MRINRVEKLFFLRAYVQQFENLQTWQMMLI